MPFDAKTVKSAYHTRGYDVQRLKLVSALLKARYYLLIRDAIS